MKNPYKHLPTASPDLSAETLRYGARIGVFHKLVHQTSRVSVGAAVILRSSALWGCESCTANSTAISFPRSSYVIDFLRQKKRVLAASGHAIFVNPEMDFKRDARYRSETVNDFLSFDISTLTETISEFDPDVANRPERPFLFPSVTMDAQAFRIQRLLFAYLVNVETPDDLIVDEAALQLLRHTVRLSYQASGSLAGSPIQLPGSTLGSSRRSRAFPKKVSTRRAHRDSVEAAKEYMAAHYRKTLRLPEISEAAGVATSHFCGMFREIEGESVHVFLKNIRLRAAYDRLGDYRGRLTELALEMGFSSGNQFSTSYRSSFGEPPSQDSRRLGDSRSHELYDALSLAMR